MSLRDLLRRPSSYREGPWAYARNQMGHGYLVGGLRRIWPRSRSGFARQSRPGFREAALDGLLIAWRW